ncbi:MAG: hypothetical protein HQK57_00625 [Deltaproteobacteria bacterium]|nr:hypothetical protein [Deltaproteobacteria bacterium]
MESEAKKKNTQSYANELIFILSDNWKAALFVFSILFIGTFLIALFLPPTFRASSKFSLVMSQQIDPLQRDTAYDYKNKMTRLLQDQKEIILSDYVLTNVLNRIYLDAQPMDVSKLMEKLKEHIEITPPGGETFEGASVFYVSFSGSSPEHVVKVAKCIAEMYLNRYNEIAKSKTSYSVTFFEQQLDKAKANLDEKDARLRQYEKEKSSSLLEFLNLDPGKTSMEVGNQSLMTQAARKLNDLREELAGGNMVIEALERGLTTNKIPVVTPEMEVYGRAVTAFKSKVAQLQIQLNEMRSQFAADYGPMKEVRYELDLAVRSLREEVQRSIYALKVNAKGTIAKIHEQERIIDKLKETIQTNTEEKSRYSQLAEQYALARDAYKSIFTQREQARQANDVNQEKQYVTLIDGASTPTKPYKPNRPLLAVLGLFAGVLMGTATALLLDNVDHTIKKSQDVEEFLGIPVLGSIRKFSIEQK